ncbi:DedA family protein [Actinoplanes sp. M2I2]|uniref:DedA family protein n=1 Tax=Actinoplanes sp. M2I2 TaxID=1734444 RepID=UPI0020210A5A|nr:VTT domain-containing protein [Actinoplanes sp. M2I2]
MDLMSLVDPVMTSPLLYPLLAVLSSADGVVPIIPSEAVVLAAGVFAGTGPGLPLVVLATAAGVFAGDHLAYYLSRTALGPRLLGRSPRVERAVATAGRRLQGRAGLLIVTSRFLPGGRVTMNVAAGTTRLPLSRFSPASAIAALAWATYVAGLGVLGGAAFVANPLLGIAVGLGVSFLVAGLVELISRRRGHRAAQPTAAQPTAARPTAARPTTAWKRRLGALASATTAALVLAAPGAAASTARENGPTPQRRPATGTVEVSESDPERGRPGLHTSSALQATPLVGPALGKASEEADVH